LIDRQIINPSDGSKFKAVKNRDKIFTRNKIDRWRTQWSSFCKSA